MTHRPNIRFAPAQATQEDAEAFSRGYRDHDLCIVEPNPSEAYLAGWSLADKHRQIEADSILDAIYQEREA